MSEISDKVAAASVPDEVVDQLLEHAETDQADLLGPQGLLSQVTKRVLERALDTELTEHLGYERGDPAGAGSGNSRNGATAKTVQTDIGPVDVEVPRDRAGSFEPGIVPRYSRRLSGFNERIIALYARGMSTRDIQAHLREMYQVEVSPDLVSKVTDAVIDELTSWQNRPLEPVYPIVYIDALWIKIRDQAVANRPVYLAVGIDVEGRKEVLGLWVGSTDGEGAKYWMALLSELKNRGLSDVLICCCDGLKGLPEAIEAVWPQALVQTCVIHLIRSSLRYASRKDHDRLIPMLRRIYTAPTEQAASDALDALADSQLGRRYPAILRVWRNAWTEFTPFLAFPPEIRRIVYTTNTIESINAQLRKVTRNRGHFPSEQAALKVLYLAIRNLEQNNNPGRKSPPHWKEALNAFAVYFEDRLPVR